MVAAGLLFDFLVITVMFSGSNLSLNCSRKAIQSCQCEEDGDKYEVYCSNLGLKSVPKNIPIQTTHPYLDDNNIKILKNGSFSLGKRGLPYLVLLSVKRNNMEKIQPATFHWIPNLKELILYNNSLEKENSLPMLLFQPLKMSLKVLDIRINLMNPIIDLLNYPKSVAELYNLKELRMDCLTNKSLPAEYSSLKHLQTLNFGGGRKNIIRLHQEMFAAILELNVTKIDLTGLYIRMIGEKTFSGLKFLNWLDLSNNPDLSLSMKIFAASLNETSVTKLNLNNTGIGNASQSASILLRYFCHLPLKELTLDHNYINLMDPVFMKCFPDVKILSLGDNYLLITREFIYDTMYGLPNLIGFNLTWQRKANLMANMNHEELKTVFENKYNGRPSLCLKGMACPIAFSPNLEWVDLSHHGLYLTTFPEAVLVTNTSLKSLGVSQCGISTLKLPIYCPSDWHIKIHLERLDFSNNGLQCINATVFDQNFTNCDWNSFKYFNLRNNQLGNIDTNTCNHNRTNVVGFLRPLKSLKVIDLAMNMFAHSERLRDLKYLTNLTDLDLSHNEFKNFTLGLSSFTSLTKLNLSYNNLRCLSQKTTRELTTLQTLHPWVIEIDLTGNLLSCSCECYNFIQWMSTTRVVFTKSNMSQ